MKNHSYCEIGRCSNSRQNDILNLKM